MAYLLVSEGGVRSHTWLNISFDSRCAYSERELTVTDLGELKSPSLLVLLTYQRICREGAPTVDKTNNAERDGAEWKRIGIWKSSILRVVFSKT